MQDLLQVLINVSYAIPLVMNLVMLISVLIGVMFIGSAMISIWHRSMIGMQGGSDTSTVRAIMGRLVIGSILVSSLYWLNVMGNTLLMGRPVNGATFLYQTTGLSQNQQLAIRAIFDLIAMVGYIAVTRGWILLVKFFDNVVREYGKAIVFIVFGTLAVYLDEVLEVLGDWTGFHYVGTILF